MKIIQFITSLENGGAEKIVYQLISETREGYDQEVLVLRKSGMYINLLESKNIKVKRFNLINWLRYLCQRKDIVVHSHLYHTHLLSFFFFIFGIRVFWTIHSSFDKPSFLAKLLAALSHYVPRKITYVSNHVRKQHELLGYTTSKGFTIYNGVNEPTGLSLRLFDFAFSSLNICMVCRYHPIKGYDRFMAIAKEAVNIDSNVVFWLVGKGNTNENKDLKKDIKKNGLESKVILLGEIYDWRDRLPHFDLLVSTSYNEAYGLTILEALLSGINVSSFNLPVIEEMIGGYGVNDICSTYKDCAQRWLDKAKQNVNPALIGLIRNKYSVDRMVSCYFDIYEDCFRD
jgi:glycosyltransferase involved in cell wall biosynthesis